MKRDPWEGTERMGGDPGRDRENGRRSGEGTERLGGDQREINKNAGEIRVRQVREWERD